MKRILLVTICLSTVVNQQLHAQTSNVFRKASGVYGAEHQIYNPTTRIAGKTSSSPNMPFTSTTEGVMLTSPQAMACIAKARSLWSNVLSTYGSTVKIHIVAADMGSTGILAGTEQPQWSGLSIFSWLPSVTYGQAEANFLYSKYNGGGDYFLGDDMTIYVNSNPSVHWWYNQTTPPPPGYDYTDFLTTISHEIGHGLGFFSNYKMVSGSIVNTGPAGFATIYDAKINDNYTGFDVSICGSGYTAPLMTLSSISTAANLLKFCTGQGGYLPTCSAASNSLFFDGSATGYSTIQINTPNPWEPGSSLTHFYEVEYPTAADYWDLMQPVYVSGKQMQPSSYDLSVLGAIGWDVSSAVGTGDMEFRGNMPLTAPPPQVLTLGTTTFYYLDQSVGIDYTTGNWTLNLFADDGIYTVASHAGYSEFVVNLTSLPDHPWSRDLNGRIQGELVYTGSDASSMSHSCNLAVYFNYPPQNLKVKLNNTSDYWCECDKATVGFYAAGASSYKIAKRTQLFTGTWSLWSAPITVPEGTSEYTFAGLNEYDNYQFQVQAVNDQGSVMSTILERDRCKHYIKTNPNPVSATVDGHFTVSVDASGGNSPDCCDDDCGTDAQISVHNLGLDGATTTVDFLPTDPCGPKSTNITDVILVSVTNPQLVYPFTFQGVSTSEQINCQNVQSGIYTLSVYNNGDLIGSQEIEIQP